MPQSKKRTKRKAPKRPRTPREEPVSGALVQLLDANTLNVQALGEVKARELPTLLRQAANVAEKLLVEGG